MQSPLLQGFVLIAGAWACCISLCWLALAQLPFWQKRFPLASRSARSALIAACLISLAALLQPSLSMMPGALQPSVKGFALRTTPAANIYLGNDHLGQSPLRVTINKTSPQRLAIIADPLHYNPYILDLQQVHTRQLDIQLFARQDAITEVGILPQDILVQSQLEDGFIKGQLKNHSGLSFDYVILIFLLYDAEAPVGHSYALLHGVGEESQNFSSSPLPDDVQRIELAKIQTILAGKAPLSP